MPSKGLVRNRLSSWRRHVILKTAAALGLTVPPSLLHEVIEQDIEFVTRVPLSREPICLLLTAERFGGVLSVAWRRLGPTMTEIVSMLRCTPRFR